jgi:nucleotide-binding universal stress UspA family protein
MTAFQRILAANDGSENAFKALGAACDLAAKYQAELHVILVEEVPALPLTLSEVQDVKASEDRQVRTHIKRSESIAARAGVAVECHVFTGHVVRNVVDFATDNGFDLLVIGATGHAAFYEQMMGTRADRIAHMARCPVLIVR